MNPDPTPSERRQILTSIAEDMLVIVESASDDDIVLLGPALWTLVEALRKFEEVRTHVVPDHPHTFELCVLQPRETRLHGMG